MASKYELESFAQSQHEPARSLRIGDGVRPMTAEASRGASATLPDHVIDRPTLAHRLQCRVGRFDGGFTQ